MTIHAGDALAFDFSILGPDLRVVGNLPYNISTPILFHLLDKVESIRDIHVMLQKEVVDRMVALPGRPSAADSQSCCNATATSSRYWMYRPSRLIRHPKSIQRWCA